MIYQATVVSAVIVWLIIRANVFPRFAPRIMLGEVNLGFYLSLLVIFGLVTFVIWYSERNLGLRWLKRMRYSQGAARYMDWAIGVAAFTVLVFAFGAGTLSPYLLSIAAAVMAGVAESLFLERERNDFVRGLVTMPDAFSSQLNQEAAPPTEME